MFIKLYLEDKDTLIVEAEQLIKVCPADYNCFQVFIKRKYGWDMYLCFELEFNVIIPT